MLGDEDGIERGIPRNAFPGSENALEVCPPIMGVESGGYDAVGICDSFHCQYGILGRDIVCIFTDVYCGAPNSGVFDGAATKGSLEGQNIGGSSRCQRLGPPGVEMWGDPSRLMFIPDSSSDGTSLFDTLSRFICALCGGLLFPLYADR